MTSHIRTSVVSVFVGAGMMTAAASPALAATNNNQNGLVNVAVGNVNLLNDVNIGVAAQVAAQICGFKVGPVAVLGTAVDRSGAATTVCTAGGQAIRLTQA